MMKSNPCCAAYARLFILAASYSARSAHAKSTPLPHPVRRRRRRRLQRRRHALANLALQLCAASTTTRLTYTHTHTHTTAVFMGIKKPLTSRLLFPPLFAIPLVVSLAPTLHGLGQRVPLPAGSADNHKQLHGLVVLRD